jgi:hypothetical protein
MDSYPRDFNWRGVVLDDLAGLYENMSHSMVAEVAKWRLLDPNFRGEVTWDEYKEHMNPVDFFGWQKKSVRLDGTIERHGP